MRLVTYSVQDGSPRVGLDDGEGNVFDLVESLPAGHSGPDSQPPALLDVVIEWDAWGAAVLATEDRLRQAGGQPVEGASLWAPFPQLRRDAFAIGGNYRKHVEAATRTTGLALNKRKAPVFFVKPTGTCIGPTDAIEYDPELTAKVDYEVELAVVIGRPGRDIPASKALDHVFGFMVCNDISARDLMLRNKPQIDYFRGKGLDTFLPTGPGITPREWLPDHRGLRLQLRVNGELRQDSTTDEMVRDVPEIIQELSQSLTLQAGDVIATGTPSGVAMESDDPSFLQDGDIVESTIEGLGTLRNPVRARRAAEASPRGQ